MQLVAAQAERVAHLRKNLLLYTDELYAENHSEFEMHVTNVATQKLATAEYGPVMLIVIGRVYRLQAKRFRGNIGAFFKCASRHADLRLGVSNVTAERGCASMQAARRQFQRRYATRVRHSEGDAA